VHLALVDKPAEMQQMAHECALASVHVAENHYPDLALSTTHCRIVLGTNVDELACGKTTE
jgi:hypothetical protein